MITNCILWNQSHLKNWNPLYYSTTGRIHFSYCSLQPNQNPLSKNAFCSRSLVSSRTFQELFLAARVTGSGHLFPLQLTLWLAKGFYSNSLNSLLVVLVWLRLRANPMVRSHGLRLARRSISSFLLQNSSPSVRIFSPLLSYACVYRVYVMWGLLLWLWVGSLVV